MADITDAFVAAFPDGYPVAKPEARAIGPTLEAAIGLLATAIAGGAVAVFATKADLLASGSSANAAYVYADPASVPSRPIQGNNGLWVKDGIWTYAATFVLPATVLADLLDQQNQIAAETAARIAADDALGVLVGGAVDFGRQCATRWRHVVGTRPQTPDAGPVYGPADYRTWMVGINPPRAVRSRAAIVWRVSFDAQPARIGMRVVRRPGEVGDGASGSLIWPSAHEGDVLVQGLTWYDAADVMADPALYGSLQTITLPMAGDVGFLTPENIYFVQIYATDAASTYLAIGMQRGRTATGADPLWKRGGFSTDPTPGAGGFVPSDGGMVAHDLAEAVYIAGEDAVRTDQDPSRIASIGVPASHHTEDAGSAWAVRLPDVSIDLQPAPVGQDSTGEILLGIPKVGAPTGVRYDVLVANPDTGQTLVAFGLERTKDAIEYIPDNIGFSRLGYLRVSSSGVEYIKTSGFRHHVRRGEEADLSAHLRRNRSLLPATMRSIRRGLPVTLVVYTDSIHAISAGVTTDHYTPNGANRDVPGYLTDYGADTVAALPRYAGDGGPAAHIHIGAHWKIAAALGAHGGSAVTVQNMGVGGTTTGVGFTAEGAPNARNPTRLAALTSLVSASTNPLVLLNFGMNALGGASIYADYLALAAAIRAAGGEVLITTCPRPGRRNGIWVPTDSWLDTTRQTIRAAQDAKVAYMDLSRLFGDGYLGAIGLSRDDLCAANGSNHPGVYEHSVIGDYTSLIFV